MNLNVEHNIKYNRNYHKTSLRKNGFQNNSFIPGSKVYPRNLRWHSLQQNYILMVVLSENQFNTRGTTYFGHELN